MALDGSQHSVCDRSPTLARVVIGHVGLENQPTARKVRKEERCVDGKKERKKNNK